MYIEREAVINSFQKFAQTNPHLVWDADGIANVLNAAPTFDAAPVVRCKECKEWGVKKAPQQQDKFGFCACNLMDTHSDFFCAYGERKENNHV